jgi:hypothetical protein
MYAVNCGTPIGKFYTFYGEALSLPTRTNCCRPDKAIQENGVINGLKGCGDWHINEMSVDCKQNVTTHFM